MTAIVGQIEASIIQEQAAAIAGTVHTVVNPNTFVFWAGIDGTWNTAGQTAIWAMYDQVDSARVSNVVAKYYQGVGTEGTSPISPIFPLGQAEASARQIIAEYGEAVKGFLDANPDKTFADATMMMATYSRGTVTGALVTQIMQSEGVTYKGEVMIPPGMADVSAVLNLSAVSTGSGHGNLEYVVDAQTNFTQVMANDELRVFFQQDIHANADQVYITGGHGDIGGDVEYGLGINSIVLQESTDFFNTVRPGMMGAVLPERQYDGSVLVPVHAETLSLSTPWNLAYGSYADSTVIKTINIGGTQQMRVDDNGNIVENFVRYDGAMVETTRRDGVVSSVVVTPSTDTTAKTETYLNYNDGHGNALQITADPQGNTVTMWLNTRGDGTHGTPTGELGMFNAYNLTTGEAILQTTPSTMLTVEQQLTEQFNAGSLTTPFYNTFTNWVSDQLINTPSNVSVTPILDSLYPDLFPIGAFYESVSPTNDAALSIAAKTPVLLNAANSGLTVAGLTALDTNADGKLTGTELNNLNTWADLNENGLAETGEIQSLSQAVITELKSTDYTFYTQGNSQPLAGVATTPVVNLTAPTLTTPASNYRTLRDTNNHRTISMGTIVDQYATINGVRVLLVTHYGETQWYDWTANQIKQSNDNLNLIGTDGNDNFDANTFSTVSWLPSGSLVNFLAGGGDDQMGGSARADNLWGGTGNDILFSYAGDDKLYGEEGDDQLQGQDGNDQLLGGIGNDFLLGGTGLDTLSGGDGNDELQGNEGNDQLTGEAGNDKLFGQVGDDTLWGGEGDDILVGFTASNETKQSLSAGETDNDTLIGGAGSDLLIGGLGNDVLDGGIGKDELSGGDGNDQLTAGADDDKLFGGAGDDQLWGGDGNDVILGFTASNDVKQTLNAGETDNDRIYAGAGNDIVLGGLGDDKIYGETGDDELQGNEGNDQLSGGDGNDRLFGQVGDDTLYGGDGDDILLGFTANNESKQSLNAGESDNDKLYGGAGHDILIGGVGNDYLDGGAGADIMDGGLGDDTYIVNSVNDVIFEKENAGYDSARADNLWGGIDNDSANDADWMKVA